MSDGWQEYWSDEADLGRMLGRFEIVSRARQEHWWERSGERQFHSYWVIVAQKP